MEALRWSAVVMQGAEEVRRWEMRGSGQKFECAWIEQHELGVLLNELMGLGLMVGSAGWPAEEGMDPDSIGGRTQNQQVENLRGAAST